MNKSPPTSHYLVRTYTYPSLQASVTLTSEYAFTINNDRIRIFNDTHPRAAPRRKRFIKRTARGRSKNPIPLLRERVIEMAWRALMYAYAFLVW